MSSDVQFVSHIGICVSDIDRSLRFYKEGLGFEEDDLTAEYTDIAVLLEVAEPMKLQAHFVRREELRLELLYFEAPISTPANSFGPMNRIGWTHMAIRVDNVHEAAARLERLGGTARTGTFMKRMRKDGTMGEFMFCTDPDGVRIELVAREGSVSR